MSSGGLAYIVEDEHPSVKKPLKTREVYRFVRPGINLHFLPIKKSEVEKEGLKEMMNRKAVISNSVDEREAKSDGILEKLVLARDWQVKARTPAVKE